LQRREKLPCKNLAFFKIFFFLLFCSFTHRCNFILKSPLTSLLFLCFPTSVSVRKGIFYIDNKQTSF
jgi:hypothetical protein